MTKRRSLLALSIAMAVSGCSTVAGLKQDLASGYDAVAGTFTKQVDPVEEEKKKLPVYDGTCPPATIRPDLQRLVEFYDPKNPTDATRISEATIDAIVNTCRAQGDGIVMQIDLALTGRTGPKARSKSSDKPSFAYPYFVAVTDAQGNVISKEIFAASLAFGADQNKVSQNETIFQNMPVPDTAQGQSYSVIIGFQLTPEQLAYNEQHPAAATDADQAPAAASTPPAAAPKTLPAKKPAKPAGNS